MKVLEIMSYLPIIEGRVNVDYNLEYSYLAIKMPEAGGLQRVTVIMPIHELIKNTRYY